MVMLILVATESVLVVVVADFVVKSIRLVQSAAVAVAAVFVVVDVFVFV